MKTPATTAPALTRAQIDAIVSAGIVDADAQAMRTRQSAVSRAAVASAAYGCVDWYIYPDSDTESGGDARAA